MSGKKKIAVRQDEENEIPADVIAQSIVEIANGIRTLNQSRLKREAVVTLIKDKTGLTKGTIELVLNNLDQLEALWLKKK